MDELMTENSSPSSERLWKPKKWVAVALSLVTSPLGLVYVGRPKLALAYFLLLMAGVFGGVYIFHIDSIANARVVADLLAWIVPVVIAVHAYVIAAKARGVAERRWFTKWWGLLVIYSALIPLLAVRAFLFEPFRFPSDSMYPTIPAGTHFLIAKAGFGNYKLYGVKILHSARTEKLNRGDVVVFSLPDNESVSYAKRIIGLPGDVLTYRDKRLSINGQEVLQKLEREDGRQEYWTETIDGRTHHIAYFSQAPAYDFQLRVPDSKIFVMGDNRDNSKDSRLWGPIPDQLVVGRVMNID